MLPNHALLYKWMQVVASNDMYLYLCTCVFVVLIVLHLLPNQAFLYKWMQMVANNDDMQGMDVCGGDLFLICIWVFVNVLIAQLSEWLPTMMICKIWTLRGR